MTRIAQQARIMQSAMQPRLSPAEALEAKELAWVSLPRSGRKIPLSDLLEYNPETGALTWLPRPREMFSRAVDWKIWNARFAGRPAFTASDSNGYFVGAVFRKNHRAHRIAWALFHGEWPEHTIDHIDGDRANNRISNLRDVPHKTNCRNAKRPTTNTSGANGVYRDRKARKWVAWVKINDKDVTIGRFVDFEEAVTCRKRAEAELGYHPNHGRVS